MAAPSTVIPAAITTIPRQRNDKDLLLTVFLLCKVPR
jgi:hypothetical protein